jgi:chromate reductase, NAD(P)H dehydrogenase (quinone)
MRDGVLRLLAISGSLRAASSNTALLHAASALAPEGVEIDVYGGLGDLPHFNPDLEEAEPPAVTDFRARLREADGLLISSPEYAHGVPGVLKNALDWLVSGEEFIHIPVALFNASAGGTYAQASLLETLTAMSARIVAEASITVPLRGKDLDAAGIVSHPEWSSAVRAALVTFARAIETLQGDQEVRRWRSA